jgi:predicted DNA-binding mobile mystery protein A
MTRRTSSRHLRRRQLDRVLCSPGRLAEVPSFKGGYIREIREALGISSTQLGQLLGVSQPAIVNLERSERSGSVTINSLRRVARALDCKLVYALVPNGSLEDTLRARAQKAAAKLMDSVGHTMDLEAQRPAAAETAWQIDEIADELARNLDRRLWEVPD